MNFIRPLWFEAHNVRALLPLNSQVAQAPAVRRSSCVISIMTKMKEFVWEYLRPVLGSKGPVARSTVACRRECVRRSLEICKLVILEAYCGLAPVPRGGLSWKGIEMKLHCIWLDSALDLWPPGQFELGFFSSRIGCSEKECATLFSRRSRKLTNG